MGVNKPRREEIAFYLSKENLDKYLKIYSANYIATKLFYPEFTSTAGTVIDRARAFGLATHSVSSASLLNTTRTEKLNTCLIKYGVDNPSKAEEIKDKKTKKALSVYGVKNVFQAEEIKNKSKDTMLEKYGVLNVGQFLSSKGSLSKFHKCISKVLEIHNINHKNEVYGKFIKYNEYLNKIYSPIVDIFIEDRKIVIECYGDFWHANPQLYKSTDIFNTWSGTMTAQEIWKKDAERVKQIESFGFSVYIVWEKDYHSNKQSCERDILNAIKKS